MMYQSVENLVSVTQVVNLNCEGAQYLRCKLNGDIDISSSGELASISDGSSKFEKRYRVMAHSLKIARVWYTL